MKTTISHYSEPDSHTQGRLHVVAKAEIGGQVLMFNNSILTPADVERATDLEACKLFTKMVRTLQTLNTNK